MIVLGAFIGAVYGWTTINMTWPSLVALVGLGLGVGITPVLNASFGNPVVVFILLLFPLIALLQETGVINVVARFFATNRLSIGRPWIMVTMLFLGAYLCSMVNGMIALLLFIAFVRDICEKAKIPAFSPFPTTMLLGLAYVMMNAQIKFPFLGSGITLSAAYSAMTGEIFPYGRYILFMLPMNALMIGAYILIMRFILRVDVSPLKNLTPEMMGEKIHLNHNQKVALGYLAAIIVLLSASLMPKTWLLAQFLSRISVFGQVLIVVGLLMMVPTASGKPFFNFNVYASKGVAWDVFFMTAFIMPASQFLTADSTGIKIFLSQLLQPMTALSPLVFIVAIMAFTALVTNFANNIVLSIVIMPVLFSFSSQVGLNPLGMVLLMFICAQMALATPGASAMVAISYASSDLVKTPIMMRYALIMIPILFIICLVIGIPYSHLIFP